MLALQSAVIAELTVPERALQRSRTFLKSVRRAKGLSARRIGDRKASMSATAMAMSCSSWLADEYATTFREPADLLMKHVKTGRNEKSTLVGDIAFTYHIGMAMFPMGAEHWAKWVRTVWPSLIKLQTQLPHFDTERRFIRGSWDPANHCCAGAGGRVYATALAVLYVRPRRRTVPPPGEP